MVHENSQQGATGGVIWRERKPLGSGVNRVTQVGAIRRSIYMLIRRKMHRCLKKVALCTEWRYRQVRYRQVLLYIKVSYCIYSLR